MDQLRSLPAPVSKVSLLNLNLIYIIVISILVSFGPIFFPRPISEGEDTEDCPEMLVPLTTVEEGGEGSSKAKGNQNQHNCKI